MKYVLGMAAALVLTAAFAPPASADPDFADLELVPTGFRGVDSNGNWWARGGLPASFRIDLTNRLHDEDDIAVRITFPTTVLEVTGYQGEGWECWDTDTGVDCVNNEFYAVADEPWPGLTIQVVPDWRSFGGHVTVAAWADEHDAVSDGFDYRVDTST